MCSPRLPAPFLPVATTRPATQVKYVVELAKALSRHPAVHRVDLLTRLIRDPKVAPSYGELEEPLTEPEGMMGGAYICRIKCGPVDKYLRCAGWGDGGGVCPWGRGGAAGQGVENLLTPVGGGDGVTQQQAWATQ